jgi:virginiamycin B lyase
MHLRAVFAILALPGAALGQGTFVEWDIPTPNSQPHCVVADGRGRVWYAGIGSGLAGFFDRATQQFRELRPPTANSGPHGIAVGPNGSIWFTQQSGNRIARIDPDTFEITEFPLPNPGSGPHTPIWDGRERIWFTEQAGNRIGRIHARTGAIEEFPIPTPGSGPYGIIADAAGNAWFCSFGRGANRLGRVDAQSGQIREFVLPSPDSGPRRPWIDSKGRIWLTEFNAHRIAVFDPTTERFTEWDTPSRNSGPYGIVVDRDDRVWYNEFNANTLVRFDPVSQRSDAFPQPGAAASIRIVAVDGDNRVWYGENRNSKIGMFLPQTSLGNAASYREAAPGGLVTIFGEGLVATESIAGSLPLPRTLGGATVRFGSVAAPLLIAYPGQINAQVPFETPPGPVRVEVRRGPMTMTQTVTILPAAPALFSVDRSGEGPGVIAHAADFQLVTSTNPARAGEFVAIYATGLGLLEGEVESGALPPEPAPRSRMQPEVTIGGRTARVTFAGAAPLFPGVNQINVEVPAGLAPGAHPVRAVTGGVASNTVTLEVR